ncbi:MAG: hypothetical protein R3F24_13790 [Gammaproteobacteria bacterium]
MTIKRRLARLEEMISPDEVNLLHQILATGSAEYSAWLDDEVAAGRLRHGNLTRLILQAGKRWSDEEVETLLAEMNRTSGDPKPPRPAPRVEARIPAGYHVAAEPLPELPAAPAIPPPVTAEPPAPVPTEPAHVVRFIRGTVDDDDLNYNPMSLSGE